MGVLDTKNLILEQSSIHSGVFITIILCTIRESILVLLVINCQVAETAPYLIQEAAWAYIEYF